MNDFELSVHKTIIHLDNDETFMKLIVGKIHTIEDLLDNTKKLIKSKGYSDYISLNSDEVYMEALLKLASQYEDVDILKTMGDVINILEFDKIARVIKLPLKWLSPNVYKKIGELLKPFNVERTTIKKQTSYRLREDSEFSVDIIQKVLTQNSNTDLSKGFDFFPTPKPLVEKCQRLLNVTETCTILEPSAGIGSLVDGLDKKNITCVETNEFLSSILEGKGYVVANYATFEDLSQRCKYDRIIMNPPFSKRTDAKHVVQAFRDHLNDKGILVAITSTSIMTAKDKHSKEFQKIVNSNSVHQEQVDGAFKESGKGTGISILITKFVKK